MNLNLDALHLVPETLEFCGSRVRRIGKTTYTFYTILGYLEVLENCDIIVLIRRHQDLPDYFNTLDKLFKENNLEPKYDISSRRMYFKNNSNRIKFITVSSIKFNHPSDFSNDGNLYLITDLENMPSQFYKEEITIDNCKDILDKYKNYLQRNV